MKRTILCCWAMLLTFFAAAQTITGKVVNDETGTPLEGVTVSVKSTNQTTVTNKEGNYSITVPSGTRNAKLVFTYAGADDLELDIVNGSVAEARLKLGQRKMEEVVVIGYGTSKKKDLTGSVISVKADEIKKIPAANLMESLQGKLPGADITRNSGSASSGVNITIRGNRSIAASNGPLFIVDGIQYSSIQDINPNDIQSMEVLKDASSTAVYGSRGANGVILITTKKGNTGKPRIEFNSYYGVSSVAGYPRYMNAQEYADLRRAANRRITLAGINPGGSWTSTANDPLLFNPQELANLANNVNTDYTSMVINDGSQQEHQVGVSAGSEKTKAYLSLSYYNEKGLFKKDDLKRYTARLNLDQSLGKIAKVGMQMQFTYFDVNVRNNPLDEASKISPSSLPYDSLGNIVFSPNNDAARWNPLIDEQDGIAVNNTVTTRTFGVVYAEFTPIKGLNIRSNLGMIFNNSRAGSFFDRNSLLRRGQDPVAQYTAGTSRNTTWENIFTYNRQIKDHNFTLTGVTSFLQNNSEFVTAQGGRQILPSQLFYSLSGATADIAINSGYTKENLISYTGRVNYAYKGRYLASATFRTDGSSKLSAGNQWQAFPAVALGWRISDEAFMKDNKKINELKLRVSYGLTGSDAITAYRTQSLLTRIPNSFGENAALGLAFSDTVGNPNLKWEKTKAFNAGLDFGLFNNRVTGTIDFYKTNTSDLLLLRRLPATSGVGVTFDNVGSTENLGIDIGLNIAVIRKKDFTFNAGITFFTNKERITGLPNNTNDIANNWFIGSPVNILYDFRKTGIWQLADSAAAIAQGQRPGDIRVADINGDNVINTNDREVIGQLVPKWNSSLNLDFRYKNFDLNVFLFARVGQMMNYGYYTRFHMPGRENSAVVNYWTPENGSNDFPRPRTTAAFTSVLYSSTLGYTDASFLKVRSLTLGYNLPKNKLSRLGVSNVRFYVTGRNLFTFSKIKDYDVERGGGLTNPLTRLVLAGVNIDL